MALKLKIKIKAQGKDAQKVLKTIGKPAKSKAFYGE
jgi:phosphotransferase system HPr-like phosphotransfer protein